VVQPGRNFPAAFLQLYFDQIFLPAKIRHIVDANTKQEKNKKGRKNNGKNNQIKCV